MVSPTVWQDEVQIADCARVLKNPATDWSVTVDSQGRPALSAFPTYLTVLGAWLQITGTSIFAVRLLPLLSAVGATLVFWQFLKREGIPPWHSVLIALALWFDPVFVSSFRGARADAFVFMLCFAACWAWRAALERDSARISILAGAIIALAALAWATAVVTLSLAAYVYFTHVKKQRVLAWKCCGGAVLGIALVLVLYLACYHENLNRMLSSTGGRIAAASPYRHSELALFASAARETVQSYPKSPWVPLWILSAVGVALWRRRDLGLLGLIAITFFFIVSFTSFYNYRLLYFVPLMYFLVARTMSPLGLRKSLLVLLVIPSMAVNLGLRTGIAIAERQQRDYARYAEQLVRLVPSDAVVVGGYDYYYVGLANNWKMFPPDCLACPNRPTTPFYLVIWRKDPVPDLARDYRPEYLGTAALEGDRESPNSLTARGYMSEVYLCHEVKQ